MSITTYPAPTTGQATELPPSYLNMRIALKAAQEQLSYAQRSSRDAREALIVVHREAVADRQRRDAQIAVLRDQRVQLEVDLAQAREDNRKLRVDLAHTQADRRQMRAARDDAAARLALIGHERDDLTAQRDHARQAIARMRDISAHFAD
jgi:hypothetical protein